ncbi:MAG: hypothetical protein GY743_08925 [Planctomycetaceae bacterium]|nr:hypothetical protein [Planctomycetaceae bacterium]
MPVGTIVGEGAQFNHLATLGRILFYDKNLSRNSLVSCSSCHKQDKGFDDPSRFSIGFEGRITSRSAMVLANVRFSSNARYFFGMNEQKVWKTRL